MQAKPFVTSVGLLWHQHLLHGSDSKQEVSEPTQQPAHKPKIDTTNLPSMVYRAGNQVYLGNITVG
jgi:hypothetical protein